MNWRESKSISLAICLFAYLIAAIGVYYFAPHFSNDDALWIALSGDVIATIIIFAFSLLFRNASLYDPYWSVIPPVVLLYWITTAPTPPSIVSWLALIIVTLWSIRLTYNWARGWQNLNHEDWRYGKLRQENPKVYPLVNFFGIHFFPTTIVFLCLIPFYYALQQATQLTALHVIGLCISLSGFLLQLIADEQLYAWRKTDQQHGCIQTGLWRHSRHPNYLGEILLWWGGFFLAIGTDIQLFWTIIGPILLTAMFRFISIPMIEKRHLEKRKCYNETIKKTPMLIGIVK